MSKVKPGDILHCEVCGLTLIVDEECGCAMAELVCCEEPMKNKGLRAPKKEAVEPKQKFIEQKETKAAKAAKGQVKDKAESKKASSQKTLAKSEDKKSAADKKTKK